MYLSLAECIKNHSPDEIEVAKILANFGWDTGKEEEFPEDIIFINHPAISRTHCGDINIHGNFVINNFENSIKHQEIHPKKRYSGQVIKKKKSPTGKPCLSCDGDMSVAWRKVEINQESVHYCNPCGLRFTKGKFCGLCFKAYYDTDINPVKWKACKDCGKYVHRSCLSKYEVESPELFLCKACK